MPTYVCQIDVHGGQVENPQRLVSIWSEIQEEIEQLGATVLDTYTILGEYDFLLIFEVDGENQAFQVTQVIERNGLDTATMQAFPIDRIGELVDDV